MGQATMGNSLDQFVNHTGANVRYWLRRVDSMPAGDMAGLEEERQNIFRAAQIGIQFPQTQPDTAQLMLQVWPFIEGRGYWRDWMPLLSRAADGCQQDRRGLKCRLLNRLGRAQRLEQQWEAAVSSHQKARAVAQEIGDEELAAEATYYLCSDYQSRRQFDEAERYGLEALATQRRIAPGSQAYASTLNELGQVARWQGDLETAEKRFSEVVALWRQWDDPSNLGLVLTNLGETLHAAGRYLEALNFYQEAIEFLSQAGSTIRAVLAQTNLGALYYQMEAYDEAEKVFRQIDMNFLRQVGNLYYQAVVYQSLGNVLLAQERLETAVTYLRHSRDLWLQLDDEINLANTVSTLGEAYVAQGKPGEAVPFYRQARQLLANYPDHVWARKLLQEAREALAQLAAQIET